MVRVKLIKEYLGLPINTVMDVEEVTRHDLINSGTAINVDADTPLSELPKAKEVPKAKEPAFNNPPKKDTTFQKAHK